MSDNGVGTKQSGVELEPCPFCGGEVFITEQYNFKCRECGVVCRTPLSDKEKANAEAGLLIGNFDFAHNIKCWNTRAERTCHMDRQDASLSGRFGMGYFICSDCQCVTVAHEGHSPSFCSHCGAKVVG